MGKFYGSSALLIQQHERTQQLLAAHFLRFESLDIQFIQELMQANPSWLRTRLSKELCTAWNWRNAKGQLEEYGLPQLAC